MNRKGISLIEIMFSIAILGVVFSLGYRLMGPTTNFFRYGLARQKTNSEARACMNTIGTAMRGGLANSVRLSTPNTSPAVPWSSINFALAAPLASGTTAYAFTLVNHTVQMQEFSSSGVVRNAQLATNVSKLMFVPLDIRDPSIMMVSLRIDAPLENSGQTSRITTVELNQEIHMLVNY